MKFIYTIAFLCMIGCILTRPELSLHYALLGLHLWFDKMIPALLPFMILSGIMIRMGITENFSIVLYPVLHPLYRISKNGCYALFMGFLCGFPMGAKTISDLYERNLLAKKEAEYLLSFCNNIGPVYFVSFALPLIGITDIMPYLFGMYGIPLLYGLLLRVTIFRKLNISTLPANRNGQSMNLLLQIDDAVQASLQSILSLGGYMILFNLLNLVPHVLLNSPPIYLAPLFEISGGLSLLDNSMPLYSLVVLAFGGLSCLAQTYSCIRKTDLSIAKYTKHKVILTILEGCYYRIL